MCSWSKSSCTLLAVLVFCCLVMSPVIAESGVLDIAPAEIHITTDSGRNTETGFTVMNLAENPGNFTVSYVRSTETETVKVLEPRYVSFPREPFSLSPQESIDIPFNVSTSELGGRGIPGHPPCFRKRVPAICSCGCQGQGSVIVAVYCPGFLHVRERTPVLPCSIMATTDNPGRRLRSIRSKVIADQELETIDFARFFRDKVMTTLDETDGENPQGTIR